jgi:hypothetical protein
VAGNHKVIAAHFVHEIVKRRARAWIFGHESKADVLKIRPARYPLDQDIVMRWKSDTERHGCRKSRSILAESQFSWSTRTSDVRKRARDNQQQMHTLELGTYSEVY